MCCILGVNTRILKRIIETLATGTSPGQTRSSAIAEGPRDVRVIWKCGYIVQNSISIINAYSTDIFGRGMHRLRDICI